MSDNPAMPESLIASESATVPDNHAVPESTAMSKSLTLSVRSLTGNTRKIADGLRRYLENTGWHVTDHERGASVADDLLVICFWCKRSTLDPVSAELIEACEGKRVLVFGTLGGYPDSPYAEKVIGNVTELVSARNECLGVFLSQGKVSMKNIERRRQLPLDDPHHLDEAGVARLMESQKHPDQADIDCAVAFLAAKLSAL
mgnify:CR=1 FL=1